MPLTGNISLPSNLGSMTVPGAYISVASVTVRGTSAIADIEVRTAADSGPMVTLHYGFDYNPTAGDVYAQAYAAMRATEPYSSMSEVA